MQENCTSGLMSGERKRSPHQRSPRLSSALLKRNKTDMADAEAICEAVTRPTMRFVPVKTAEQQADDMILRRESC